MLNLRKSFSALVVTSLLFTNSVGAVREVRAQSSVTPEARLDRTSTLIQDELYFGRVRPGGIVSEEQFQRFLQNVVTPRFPDGLTVLDAKGQFRDRTGTIIKEPTKIVVLIYPNNQEKRRAIQEIIYLYKTQFQQESVLRVTSTPEQVGF